VSSFVSAPGAPPRLRQLPVADASRARRRRLPCHARKPDQGEMAEGRHGAPLQEPHIRLSRAAHWARRPPAVARQINSPQPTGVTAGDVITLGDAYRTYAAPKGLGHV
jgi:hypothetical protein